MENKVNDRRSLLLNEAVRSIEFAGEAHSHPYMGWQHAVDPASIVDVGDTQ